ncbi:MULTISPECIES: hypothetical protein [unclassified Shewanella]|uniref:hypothetical protein n=1 Tax=unclassified Shewanella TaxID=196818 RepID=UPI000C7D2BB7|nr:MULTISPECIES: hypothetical protein [unclassified Shewanella]PKG57539.1 hypothetical protein CXF82_09120 [Shewanella sp. GutDb-MelDb]PKG75745.1 hypothetical protein CXF86_05900 [Shewanella sp. GutCb]
MKITKYSQIGLLTAATFALPAMAVTTEQTAFFDSIAAHCGKAFEGTVTAGNTADSAFSGKKLIMHVRECSDTELKVPFHVGDDHSRTWVITKTSYGLHLAHDHRHKDGSEDKVTMYGGMTAGMGSATEQSFPVDAYSINNFRDNGLDVSITNVWHMYTKPTEFTYRLTRDERDFRVDFDLTKPVALPPAPWGHK